jgi:hypothetical protein
MQCSLATVAVLLCAVFANGWCVNLSTQNDGQLEHYKDACVKTKFRGNDTQCVGADILKAFAKQIFRFRHAPEVKRFTAWLRLLYQMQQYAPQKQTLATVAGFMDKIVRIVDNITYQMQLAGDDMYYHVAQLLAGYHRVVDFDVCFTSYRNFFNSYVLWAPSRYKTLLSTYARIRSSFQYSRHLTTAIDEAAFQLMTLTLEYPLMLMRPHHARQEAYIYYVSKLSTQEKQRFNGLYETIEEKQFPQTTVLHSGPINITVRHDITDLNTLNRMQEESNFVYSNFVRLWERLNVTYTHTIMNVNMYVYENKTEYSRTGLLYSMDVNNGGIALYYPRKIVSLVYFDGVDVIPRAFGHELFHCLLFSTNRRVLRRANSRWFVEGAANRFGFRKCIWRDHVGLKTYKQKTINEIVSADYDSDILYSMGSVLVSFLYEKRPDILREAVLSYNYSIRADHNIEQEFSQFKTNKILECNYVRYHQPTIYKNTVQQQYVAALPKNTFSGLCRNYIRVDFDNGCVFIMTPSRLYKTSNLKNASALNVQYELYNNNQEVSSLDFEFFLKGTLKLAVKYMLNDTSDPHDIANKYFSVDAKYSYAAKASCQSNAADPSKSIIDFVLASPIIGKSALAHVGRPREMIARFEETMLSCQVFVAPPVTIVSGRLRTYVEHIDQLRDQHIAEVNLVKPLDVHNNTIMHLAAMYNRILFDKLLRQHEKYVTSVVNADNHTAMWTFENTQKYYKRFRHAPNRYCTTIVPGNYTYVYVKQQPHINRVTHNKTVANETIGVTSTSNNVISTLRLHAGNVTMSLIEKSPSISGNNNLLIITTEVIVGIVIVISVNTIITIKVVRHYIRKSNSNSIARYNSTNNFNKQKFYNECSVPLF